MKKRFFIIIIILSLVVLTGHIHLRHSGSDAEDHCPFCALLHTGLGFSLPFELSVSVAVLAVSSFNAAKKIDSLRIFSNRLRAPPFYFNGQGTLIDIKWRNFNEFKISENINRPTIDLINRLDPGRL
jgi:hypothetical protein